MMRCQAPQGQNFQLYIQLLIADIAKRRDRKWEMTTFFSQRGFPGPRGPDEASWDEAIHKTTLHTLMQPMSANRIVSR